MNLVIITLSHDSKRTIEWEDMKSYNSMLRLNNALADQLFIFTAEKYDDSIKMEIIPLDCPKLLSKTILYVEIC